MDIIETKQARKKVADKKPKSNEKKNQLISIPKNITEINKTNNPNKKFILGEKTEDNAKTNKGKSQLNYKNDFLKLAITSNYLCKVIGNDDASFADQLKPIVEKLEMNHFELSFLHNLLELLEWDKIKDEKDCLSLLIAATIYSKVIFDLY